MLAFFRQPRKRFSLENLKYQYGVLKSNDQVHAENKELVVETLRCIAELMIWGDQHNDQFFFFFCEKAVLVVFLRILENQCEGSVVVQLLQTLSMMIQNFQNETSMYYLLSNNHVNDIIVHQFDFSNEEILAYYITFLKTLSLRLNTNTLQFFFDYRTNDFPLYTEGVKFFNNDDTMIRIAVRTLTLNVYQVNDPDLRAFILNRHAVPYFSNLVFFIRDEAICLNELWISKRDVNKLAQKIDEQIDTYHYLMEIFRLHIEELSEVLMDQLLSNFVLPLVIGSLSPSGQDHQLIIPVALYLSAQILEIFDHIPFINSIVISLLHPFPPMLAMHLNKSPPEYPIDSSHSNLHISDILFPQSANTSIIAQSALPRRSDPKAIMQRDLNLQRVRSQVPELRNVTLIQSYPNYNSKSPDNIYRTAFFSFLSSFEDEIVSNALNALLSLLSNKNIDMNTLIECNICPQKDRRSRRLFDALVSSEEETDHIDESQYDHELIKALLHILSKKKTPVQSLQMASRVLLETANDNYAACLVPEHLQILGDIIATAATRLVNISIKSELFIEIFEDCTLQAELVADRKPLSPMTELDDPADYSEVSSDICHFVIVHKVWLEIHKVKQTVALIADANELVVKKNMRYPQDMEKMLKFRCWIQLQGKRTQQLLLIDSPTVYLIDEKDCIIKMVAQVSKLTAKTVKSHSSTLEFILRATRIPHISCDRISGNKLWRMFVEFEDEQTSLCVYEILRELRSISIQEQFDRIQSMIKDLTTSVRDQGEAE